MSAKDESDSSDGILKNAIDRVITTTEITQADDDAIEVERAVQADEEAISSPIKTTVKETRQNIQDSEHDTVFDLYDALVDLDGELSGAVNAIAQSASYKKITLPTDEPSNTEKDILKECRTLARRIRGQEMAIDVLRNLVKYGNDINKKVYNERDGIIAAQSLPVNAITIVDDRNDLASVNDASAPGDVESLSDLFQADNSITSEGDEEIGGEKVSEAFERDAYVLNEVEEGEDAPIIEPWNTLHFSIDARSNWFEDHTGRDTYGVWGQSRLEALKFTIQTKYNTLTNKVAMDDKLLAREVYYIDTAELFGDIQDRQERIEKAQDYADTLADMIQDLGPDERPMLPDHVEVEVIGPEGKAIDQKPFVEQLNNGIAAALTFPMAGLGRGTTSVKAGEEISSLWAENNIKNLRRAVIRGFRELFRDHIKVLASSDQSDAFGNDIIINYDEAENIGEMRLDPDLSIPTLEYEPFRQEDRTQLAEQIDTLVKIGVMSRREAREEWGLPTDEDSMKKLREQFKTFSGGSSSGQGTGGGGGVEGGDSPPTSDSESEVSEGDEEESGNESEEE